MNGIYIHIPFCIKKCKYCDFASFEGCLGLDDEYLSAVRREMKRYPSLKADTLYVGGGTPTVLEKEKLCRLIADAQDHFSLTLDAEITVECNPKTADLSYFKSLIDLGVNRLSIGVQSLNPKDLEFLGRAHNVRDAVLAIELAKDAGFKNISVDVMFGLKCQTENSVIDTIDRLISLEPTHFSCYSLIIEDGTPFGKMQKSGEILTMDEDDERFIYHKISSHLEKNGYFKYEISNYAKEGFISRHNSKYWDLSSYVGLGCSAHSYFGGARYENCADIKKYINDIFENKVPEKTISGKDDMISEFMFLGLRRTKGVSKKEFKRLFSLDLDELYKDEIKALADLGLLSSTEDNLCLTQKGIDVSNEIFIRFLR